MATISPIRIPTPHDGQVRLYEWLNLTETDTAEPVLTPGRSEKTVQIEGAFGGGTVVLEGSLMQTVPAYHTLTDPAGVALSFTAPGLRAIMENVYALRPRVAAGAGVHVTVYLLTI